MGIQLDEREAHELLRAAHTGVITTLRSDGWPVALPVWFVFMDGAIWVRTPSRSRKVAHVRRDDRVSFLVESGKAWKELRAVVVTGRATIVEDPEAAARAERAIAEKYAGYRLPAGVPQATRRHYGSGFTVLRIDPAQPFLTWDNAKIRLRG